MSKSIRTTHKLAISTFAIARQIAGNDDIKRSFDVLGINILQNISQYVCALTVYFSNKDGELSKEEESLIINYLSTVQGLDIDFPKRNQLKWAEEILLKHPLFLKFVVMHDIGCETMGILWHIRHIILTIIAVDENFSDAEINEVRLYLQSLQALLDSKNLSWSFDILDSPPQILEKISDFSSESSYVQKTDGNSNHNGEDLESYLKKLNDLVGLSDVKQEVTALINLVKIRQLRISRGMKMPDTTLHMVFSGSPGTGKTTVARLLGSIYKALGVLSKGHVVEVDRSGLVAGYVGQTAIKTMDALKKAHGGILFIDEAYTLVGKEEDNFGQEAIDTVLKYMEDNRDDIIVIVAGYVEQMKSFVLSNPGLQSRFNKYINFADYSVTELYEIYLRMSVNQEYYYNQEVAQLIYDGLEKTKTNDTHFANARTVRNIFESIITQHANRIASEGHSDNDSLCTIDKKDVEAAFLESAISNPPDVPRN
jgi:stage V sporulation protein K